MPRLPMNPLGAFLISSSSGISLYIILRVVFDGTQKGSAIAALIWIAAVFGALIVEDD